MELNDIVDEIDKIEASESNMDEARNTLKDKHRAELNALLDKHTTEMNNL